MLRKAAQSFSADMTFADMPVPIDARVERRARIVEVHGAHVFQSHRAPNDFNRRFQPVRLAKVVAGGKRMRGVNAYTEREFRTRIHNRAQMFEAMTDALALTGRVLQQNAQLSELQTF